MELVLKKLEQPEFPHFMLDYLRGGGNARDYFSAAPTLEGIKETAREMVQTHNVDKELLTALRLFNEKLGAREATIRNIESLKKKTTVVIATGQQPGLLTGSLFTIYKTIQALALCHHLNQNSETVYVPLFWTASDDQRLNEVDHLDLLGRQGRLHKLKLDFEAEAGTPFFHLKTRSEFLALIKQTLQDQLVETEFRADIIERVATAFRASENMAEWFSRLLGQFFFKYGLIIYDPAALPVARYARRLFQDNLERPELLHALTKGNGGRLRRDGYQPQVPPKTGKLPFFLFEGGKRQEITLRDGSFFLGSRRMSREQIAGIIEKSPQKVSPNVFLRPLAQQALFPVAGYVGGPSEVAYHAQLDRAYQEFDLVQPVIYPRWQLFIEEAKASRIINRYRLTWEQLKEEPHRIIYQIVKNNQGAEIEERWRNWQRELRSHINKLPPLMGASLPNWEQKVQAFARKAEAESTRLYQNGWNEIRKRESKTGEDLEYAHNAFFPYNIPAERIFNIFPLLVKYGPDFLDELLTELKQIKGDTGGFLVKIEG